MPTAATRPVLRISFESTVCERCHGTGHHANSKVNGTSCAACKGQRTIATPEGREAYSAYIELVTRHTSKPVSSLKPGHQIIAPARNPKGNTPDLPPAPRTVAEVIRHAPKRGSRNPQATITRVIYTDGTTWQWMGDQHVRRVGGKWTDRIHAAMYAIDTTYPGADLMQVSDPEEEPTNQEGNTTMATATQTTLNLDTPAKKKGKAIKQLVKALGAATTISDPAERLTALENVHAAIDAAGAWEHTHEGSSLEDHWKAQHDEAATAVKNAAKAAKKAAAKKGRDEKPQAESDIAPTGKITKKKSKVSEEPVWVGTVQAASFLQSMTPGYLATMEPEVILALVTMLRTESVGLDLVMEITEGGQALNGVNEMLAVVLSGVDVNLHVDWNAQKPSKKDAPWHYAPRSKKA